MKAVIWSYKLTLGDTYHLCQPLPCWTPGVCTWQFTQNTVQLWAEPHSCYSSHRQFWSDSQQQAGLLLSLRHTACKTPSKSAGLVFWKWTAVLGTQRSKSYIKMSSQHWSCLSAMLLQVLFKIAFQRTHAVASKHRINEILPVSHFWEWCYFTWTGINPMNWSSSYNIFFLNNKWSHDKSS